MDHLTLCTGSHHTTWTRRPVPEAPAALIGVESRSSCDPGQPASPEAITDKGL